MIYTVENTLGKRRPIQIILDGKKVPATVYLDRRRRIIRKFKTDGDGKIIVDWQTHEVSQEEIRYGHRQVVKVVYL